MTTIKMRYVVWTTLVMYSTWRGIDTIVVGKGARKLSDMPTLATVTTAMEQY